MEHRNIRLGTNTSTEVQEYLKTRGLYEISEEELLQLLGLAFRRQSNSDPETSRWDKGASSYIVTGLDPARLKKSSNNNAIPWLGSNRMRHLAMALQETPANDANHAALDAATETVSALREAIRSGPEHLKKTLQTVILQRFSTLLMLPVENIEPGKPLVQYGMDSMIAAQLRN